MRLTRFERKIVAAIAAVAFVPLIGTLLLGRAALREAYEVGVNVRVRDQLDQALDVYRAHFVALRDDAERTADAVAADWRLHAAVERSDREEVSRRLHELLGRYPNIARVRVRNSATGVIAEADNAPLLDETRTRLLTLRRDIEATGSQVQAEVTIGTPMATFEAYQRAGEVREVYARLEAGAGYVSGSYLVVFIGFLLSVIVVAMAVGIVLSRRVTRRVADLAEATARVGAGDLTVEVPTDANDEVGELTRAFNEMVRDMRESRGRIDYLQRIGAWQEFARRLAHEIKNPLTPIQLAVQEVQQSYAGPDEAHREKLETARHIVEEEVATLRRLVGEFSAFAKLPQAELTPADLGDFVADLDKSMAAILEAEPGFGPGVEVVCASSDERLPVRIDPMMLKRCVDNLVRNALAALRPGAASEARGRVVVEARKDRDEAVLEVRDTGPGVPEPLRTRVFDPYYTTRADGTGLGLAIVKKVVLEHGGEIDCGPAPEGGAAFRIRLPLSDIPRRERSGRR